MDREKELIFFGNIKEELKRSIDRLSAELSEQKEGIRKAKAYVNENFGEIDEDEMIVSLADVNNLVESAEADFVRLECLKHLADSPYFAKIDFTEDGGSLREIRLGSAGFFSTEEKKIKIYDWRAPVSSLYYDYELGRASYTVKTKNGASSETRTYSGVISEKDQFVIRKGEMLKMADTGRRITDELLLSALSGNAPEKMRPVIATIQKEQNEVIRDSESEVLVVDGRAGSGKTVIAMHRLAWLLYNESGQLNSGNVMILSPNNVFSDYISEIMPELGEDNIPEKHWDDLMEEIILSDYEYESGAEQAECIRTLPATDVRIGNLRLKNSFAFYDAFCAYIDEVFIKSIQFKDFHYEKMTYPAEKLEKLFRVNFSSLPPYERFYNIAFFILDDYLLLSGKNYSEGRNERVQRQIADLLIKRFAEPDLMSIYADFLSVAEKAYPGVSKVADENGRLYYEDMQVLFWLQLKLYGCNTYKDIKHVMIDEMQDYSVFRLAVIKQLFPGRKTFLGDKNQVLLPDENEKVTEAIAKLFPDHRLVTLQMSYRSTAEITAFANRIIGDENGAQGYIRHGEEPETVKFENEDEMLEKLVARLGGLTGRGYGSIALICENDETAYELFRKLQKKKNEAQAASCESGMPLCPLSDMQLNFVSERSITYRGGISIMSAFISKGMEFDAVCVVTERSFENIKNDAVGRNALYIACTRALHELTVFVKN